MQIVIDIHDIPKNDHERWVLTNGTPLPKGHGRLIDADSLIKAIEEKAKRLSNADTINGLCGAVALIFDALTIIEADKAESEEVHSMTIECAIKELKEDIDLYIPLHGTIDDVDRELPDGRLITALEMAIASLDAWGKVKAEIEDLEKSYGFDKATKYGNKDEKQMDLSYSTMYMYEIAGLVDEIKEIIDKHLQEVTTDE